MIWQVNNCQHYDALPKINLGFFSPDINICYSFSWVHILFWLGEEKQSITSTNAPNLLLKVLNAVCRVGLQSPDKVSYPQTGTFFRGVLYEKRRRQTVHGVLGSVWSLQKVNPPLHFVQLFYCAVMKTPSAFRQRAFSTEVFSFFPLKCLFNNLQHKTFKDGEIIYSLKNSQNVKQNPEILYFIGLLGVSSDQSAEKLPFFLNPFLTVVEWIF